MEVNIILDMYKVHRLASSETKRLRIQIHSQLIPEQRSRKLVMIYIAFYRIFSKSYLN